MAQEQFRLVDGTIVRKCLTEKPLYCSRKGKFYSVHKMVITDEGCIMREIKPSYSPASANPKNKYTHGGAYPIMRQFDKQLCHKLVAGAWIGERPNYLSKDGTLKPMEIDHLNGNILDWSTDNLQYVTPAENCRRAKILRAMRAAGLNPTTYTRDELLHIFAKYEITK